METHTSCFVTVRDVYSGEVLTAFGDLDGSLSERRRGGEEGEREEEEENHGEGGAARPPIARPPTL